MCQKVVNRDGATFGATIEGAAIGGAIGSASGCAKFQRDIALGRVFQLQRAPFSKQ